MKNKNELDVIKLSSRLSSNAMSEEDLEFVREQLKDMSKSQLVRRAIKIMRKHETGELFKEALEDIKGIITQPTVHKQAEDKDAYDELNKALDNLSEFGKGE